VAGGAALFLSISAVSPTDVEAALKQNAQDGSISKDGRQIKREWVASF
jgi:hypothetical protein